MPLMGYGLSERSCPFPLIRFVDQMQAILLYKPQAKKIIEAKKSQSSWNTPRTVDGPVNGRESMDGQKEKSQAYTATL